MSCPECQKLGLKSKVYSGVSNEGAPPFKLAGAYHLHDAIYVKESRCSNGHQWTVREKLKCPTCKNKKEIEI